ncbi:MAG: tetratricopeptide repeat protein [Pyrinomonadaceae bacterium]
MPEEEIKQTFVARQPLVDELVSLIGKQPGGAGVQHVVIIAPRGMGKTTVFLMVRFAVRDGNLARRWQAVQFPEERYGINDLADFWLEVLHHLEIDTNDAELRRRIEEIKAQYTNADDLQEAALALIKDWRRKHKKRLVVLVDNFDMILEQINDERDNARLRDALMNDGTLMIIGGATTFFHEARAYDQPLYNFFKIYNLDNLKFAQMQDLLRKRAAIDEIPNFEEVLKANHSRLRVLEYFTGGNPRLVLMLYRVITQSDISEVRRGLEKLLDEVTPYYKSKVESLPPQQRKILDHIARISSQTNEGLTPTEIAAATRMTPNQASAQLKRLSESGYVQAANIRSGRNTYYTLSERLYAIWHQMRFGRNTRERMGWLVTILKALYDAEEMGTQSEILVARFHEHFKAGRLRHARDTLEHHRYLADAMGDSPLRVSALDGVIRGYLKLKDIEILKKELLTTIELKNLTSQTLKALLNAGCISQQKFDHTKASKTSPAKDSQQRQAEAAALIELGFKAFLADELEEALQYFDRALELEPDGYHSLIPRSFALTNMGRYEEALASVDRFMKTHPADPYVNYYRGIPLSGLERYEEALASFDLALKANPKSHDAWDRRGFALAELGRYEEAISSFDRSLKIKPKSFETWLNRGGALLQLGKYKDALASFERALKINSSAYWAWYGRGTTLAQMSKYEEALKSFDRALKLDPEFYRAWLNRGIVLSKVDRQDAAIESFDHALKIKHDKHEVWFHRGMSLGILGRREEAIRNFDSAIKIKSDYSEALHARGVVFAELNKHKEAIKSFDKALKADPSLSGAWHGRGKSLQELGMNEEAIASFDRALKIDAGYQDAWLGRGLVYVELNNDEEAIKNFDRAAKVKSNDDWFVTSVARLNKFLVLARQGEVKLARQAWEQLLDCTTEVEKHVAEERWHSLLTETLLRAAKTGDLQVVRDSIKDSDLSGFFFPFICAIDYLLTGEDVIIEKLSPEVRGVVEEIAGTLRQSASQAETPKRSRTPKPKSGARRRTRKQLR